VQPEPSNLGGSVNVVPPRGAHARVPPVQSVLVAEGGKEGVAEVAAHRRGAGGAAGVAPILPPCQVVCQLYSTGQYSAVEYSL